MPPPFTTGVLKLNTHFPRLLGDIGNPESLHGDVIFETVEDANPATIITGAPLPAPLIDSFVAGAGRLRDQRVNLITTSCGFLLPLQDTLTKACTVPVITSSLLLLPLLQSIHGPRVGIITFDRDKLILTPSQIVLPDAIEGLQASDSLRQTIAADLPQLDRPRALTEVLGAAERLLSQWPATQALLLECTNLSPYKSELRRQSGVAVYDLIDAIHWHQHAVDTRLAAG